MPSAIPCASVRETRILAVAELRRLPAYERACRKLFTAQEQVRAELEIAADPPAWPVIAGTGGVRKARAARGGRGKSGGARILYFVLTRRGTIYLLFAYSKSVQEDIDESQKKSIRALVAALEREAG
jgi:hypothetical protein